MDEKLKLILQKQCCASIGKFRDRVLYKTPWAARSILMSEAFAFCAIADFLDVDIILESGVYNGRSTQIWANYFLPEVSIIVADKRDFRKEAIDRLAPYDITFLKGDGPTIFNMLIAGFPGKRIAIFMDGPKGIKAINFAKEILPLPNVVMVAIHDMSVTKGRVQGELCYPEDRIEFDKWKFGRGQFLTDEQWYIKEYSWLDKDESQFDAEQKLTWHPYRFIGNGIPDRELKSYGPTIGFVFELTGRI